MSIHSYYFFCKTDKNIYKNLTSTLKIFWKLLLKTTDDPTITFQFFCRRFSKRCRSYEDHNSISLQNSTDDTMIINRFLPTIITDYPTTITYRWSDDHHNDWFTYDPTMIFPRFTDYPMITLFPVWELDIYNVLQDISNQ